jgi:DNA-binding transcriptional ArsR family regulator
MLVSQVADDRTVGIHLGVLTKRGLVEAAGDV